MNYYSGVGYFSGTVMDWLKYKTDGKDSYTIVLSARLSGNPHIGTLVNFMTGFRLAYELNKKYKKDCKMIIELLDNISDEKICNIFTKNSRKYYYKKLVSNNIELQEKYNEFIQMIKKLNDLCNVKTEIKTYKDIQQDERMRNSIFEVLQNKKYFEKILNPKEEKMHIRIPCPICGLIEKTCKDITLEYFNDKIIIRGFCPEHGLYNVNFSPKNTEYIDVNIPFRHFCKGLSLVDSDNENNSLSIQVLGNDWSGVWPLRIFCEGILHLNRHQLPTLLFSPLILKNKSKISKSLVNNDEELSSDILLDVNKLEITQLCCLWDEIGRWFQNSELFFENYDSEYFERLFNINEKI